MRMYSHLGPVIKSEEWVPYGMPAFSKLIEGFESNNIITEVMLLSRLPDDSIKIQKNIHFKKLKNLCFTVFPFKGWWKDWCEIRKKLKGEKFDLIYIDRAHVIFGAILALLGYKVVLRLHGVANLFELPFWRKRCFPSLELMSYYAPFKYVICSRDGSPGESFTNKYLKKSVPREILLNGVDSPPPSNNKADLRKKFNISPKSKIIISSGRMDSIKSMNVFLDTLIAMINKGEDIVGFLIGGGDMLEHLKETAKKAKCADRIILTGQVPHQEMNEYLSAADIFVSLNLYGNLSNCVLEAMSAGKCIVTLAPCKKSARDRQNESEEMQNALILINRDNMRDDLELNLNKLVNNQKMIDEKSKAIKKFALDNIITWSARIDNEIKILEKVAKK